MIEFRDVEHGPLHGLNASAPDAAFIGIIGLRGSGQDALLRLAAGLERPEKGEVRGPAERRLIALGEPLDGPPAAVLAVDAAAASLDAVAKAQASVALERLRRSGSTIVMSSYDESLLMRLSDEIWWLKDGRIEAMGDPREILAKFRAHVADVFTAWGKSRPEPLDARWRRGDGRARIELIETIDSAGQPCLVWRSGEDVAIRIVVRFGEPVDNPVLGIMIRTRVGFEVYGTNTELESSPIGRCEAGDLARVIFRMRCDLCPGDYTVTAASHDPDGTAHDWLDDAVAFTVADSRYTAGVANLRAKVSVER
jgi:lipopolysaccharide transport system ATP-binding protein